MVVDLALRLSARAGIVEHGLFLGLATDLIVAGNDGLRLLTCASVPRASSRRTPSRHSGGAPPVVWAVLVIGAIITITYIYLFGDRNLVVHLVITAALKAMTTLMLLVILVMDLPYNGGIRVKSELSDHPTCHIAAELARHQRGLTASRTHVTIW
jgi:hypothetical protein